MLGHQLGMLAEPIARALDLNDDGVVEQAVEKGGGDDWITKELWPNLGDASWWGGVSWRVSKPARTSRRSDTP